jgi:hypothetical protein
MIKKREAAPMLFPPSPFPPFPPVIFSYQRLLALLASSFRFLFSLSSSCLSFISVPPPNTNL